jgi:hypothetical protein
MRSGVTIVPSIFIGLVTHQRSRFPESGGANGVASRLASRLEALGVASQLLVSCRDAIEDLPALHLSSTHESSERLTFEMGHRYSLYARKSGDDSSSLEVQGLVLGWILRLMSFAQRETPIDPAERLRRLLNRR